MLNIINGVGHFLRKTGMDPFRIKADSIISNAKKRAFFNEARAIGVYLSRQLRGESLKRIGEQFKKFGMERFL